MERLTKRATSVSGVYKTCCVHFGHGVCASVEGRCGVCGYNDDAWDSLCDYENTGLTPSEIVSLKADYELLCRVVELLRGVKRDI